MPRFSSVRLRNWLDERLGLPGIERFYRRQLRQPLPGNVGWLHTLGFTLVALILLQLFTGVLLMFYYRPAGAEAYQSVRFIIEQARLGRIVHQLHALGASFLVFVLALHLGRIYFTGAYKRPRELTWMVGVLLLLVLLASAFTGSLLPWDQVAYWATTVGTAFLDGVPGLGQPLVLLARGGPDVSADTLTRFFTVHVIVLPAVLLLLIGLHLYLASLHNFSPAHPTGEPEKRGEALFAESGRRRYPDHLRKEFTMAYLAAGLLLVLAVITSPALGPQADPLTTPAGIKPAWYFLPLYQTVKYVPTWLGLLVNGTAIVLLLLVPILDRSPYRRAAQRTLAAALGFLFLLGLLVLGGLGYLSETTQTLFGRTVYFDVKGIPHAAEAKADSNRINKTDPP